jgi:hypothetical protein
MCRTGNADFPWVRHRLPSRRDTDSVAQRIACFLPLRRRREHRYDNLIWRAGGNSTRTVSRRQSEQAADNHQLRRFKSTDQNRRLRDRPPKSALGQLPLARIGINLKLGCNISDEQ